MGKITLLILLFFSIAFSQTNKNFSIDRNNKGSYIIYNSSGKLLYKFTHLNTDSTLLRTLDEIYSKADTNKNLNEPIIIPDTQEGVFNWTLIIVAFLGILGTLLSPIITNKLNRKGQFEHYKRTSKGELIDKNILELKSYLSSIVGDFETFRIFVLGIDVTSETKHIVTRKATSRYGKFIKKIESQLFNLKLILGGNDNEDTLYDVLRNIYKNYMSLMRNIRIKSGRNKKLRELNAMASNNSNDELLTEEIKGINENLKTIQEKIDSLYKENEALRNGINKTVKSIITKWEQDKYSNG